MESSKEMTDRSWVLGDPFPPCDIDRDRWVGQGERIPENHLPIATRLFYTSRNLEKHRIILLNNLLTKNKVEQLL